MANHTLGSDPVQCVFVDALRRKANKIRALKAEIDALNTVWAAGMNANFSVSADTWDVGAASQGAGLVTSLQVNQFISEMVKVGTGGSAAWNDQIVSAMCVGGLNTQP